MDFRISTRKVCRFCLLIKPDRSHHCRVCRKCVLKFDHHCKFLSSCIGINNYKYFTLLLLYSLITLLFILITSVDGMLVYVEVYGWEVSYTKIFLVVYILMFFIFISVFDLFAFHMVILCKGITTVEKKDKSRKDEDKKPFKENIEEACGEGSCFCPTGKLSLIIMFYRAKN
jgi:hypothetical protein